MENDSPDFDGSPLLDHLRLLGLGAENDGKSPSEMVDALGLGALLDAAFGDAQDVAAVFRTALVHYGLAAAAVGAELRPCPAPGKLGALMPEAAMPSDPASAVVIAVLDEALPVARPALNTHLASVWAMGASPRGAVPFGAEVTGTDLAALPAAAAHLRGASGIYGALGINDIRTPTGRRMHGVRSHGASVMQLAAADLGDQHPVIGVGFPAEVVEDTSGALLPFFVLCGVLFAAARTRALSAQIGKSCGSADLALPAVLNISYGVLSGPKDGSDPMSRALDALCAPDRPAITGLGPVHVVWPMGNGRQAQSHAVVGPKTGPLSLHLLPDDRTPSYVSLRTEAPADGSFELRAGLRLPGDTGWTYTPAHPAPGTRVDLTLRDGSIVRAYCLRETPAGAPARDMILLAFGPTTTRNPSETPLPAGCWTIWAETAGEVELFVQRDDSIDGLRSGGRQARFGHASYRRFDDAGREIERDPDRVASPIRRARSVNAYATGRNAWRVGGSFDRDGSVVPYSGLGTIGVPRPSEGDVLAPSDRSRTLGGVPVKSFFGGAGLRESGTSVAAPQIARALATAMTELYCPKSGDWPDRAALEAELATRAPPGDPQTRN